MIILGIDPGIERCGFAVLGVEKGKTKLLDCGCIRTPKELSLSERLGMLHTDLREVITKWKPNTAAVEELFFSKNTKTALTVAHARGVILLSLEESKIPARTFNPLTIKQAVCGVSSADKKQVQKMVQYELGLHIKSDDTVDAIAIALCMKAHLRGL